MARGAGALLHDAQLGHECYGAGERRHARYGPLPSAVVDSTTRTAFEAYLEHALAPVFGSGRFAAMDNLSRST